LCDPSEINVVDLSIFHNRAITSLAIPFVSASPESLAFEMRLDAASPKIRLRVLFTAWSIENGHWQ
jgi:hypothetical protein